MQVKDFLDGVHTNFFIFESDLLVRLWSFWLRFGIPQMKINADERFLWMAFNAIFFIFESDLLIWNPRKENKCI